MDDEKTCELCGHAMTFDSCGLAGEHQADRMIYLCHADDHDCYELRTVFGVQDLSTAPEWLLNKFYPAAEGSSGA